jgi:hypothetical protein
MTAFITDPYAIVQTAGEFYIGNETDQVYSINPNLIQTGDMLTIIDQGGSNAIELTAGLEITESTVTNNELVLTLSNGAIVNVRGAHTFTFNVGQNQAGGDNAGTEKLFRDFAQDILGVSLPLEGEAPVSGGSSIIKDDGTADFNPDDLLSTAMSKSAIIPGIDHDTLVPLNSPIVAALYEGDSWLNLQGTTDPVTYSFNETLPPEYTWPDTRDWQPVASHVRDVIDTVMSITDGFILPDIEKVASDGQIRFNMVETAEGTAAYAYYPSSSDIGGDVFLGHNIGTDSDSGNVEPYGAGRSTIVHELGHALGLTHPFAGASVLPASEDHSANTVMSYTDYRLQEPVFTGTQTGSGSEVRVTYDFVAPDHFMPYDIAALQAVYGPDTNYRASDNTYAFGDTPFYTTIWDAGGFDILDFSATGYYNMIDLTPGSHSNINYRDIDTQIAEQQSVYQDQFGTSHYDSWVADVFTGESADIYTGEKALGIAYGTIIEAVTGGSAGNQITDNAMDNYLTGGVGDDLFYLGAGGFDRIIGGGGYDLVVLEEYFSDQVEMGEHGGAFLLVADEFAVEMVDISGVQFADQLYTVV